MKKFRKVLAIICCLVLLSSIIVFNSTVQAASTTIDKCDSVTGWTGSNSVTLDTTNKKEGTGCLTRTGSGTDWFKKTFSPAINSGVTESNGYVHLWLYVSDATKLAATGAQLEITSSGSPDVNEYAWNLLSAGLVTGWNELNLKISNATKIGTPNLAAINFIRVYYFLTASITCRLDDVYFTDSLNTPTPTPTPTITPTPAPTSGDIIGKVMVGYQGWFDAPGDGAPDNSWVHWANGIPAPGNQRFEIYPDIREYTTLFATGYANLGNGSPAKLFSSYTTHTVNKHFEWMQTYGIDGAAVQRFGSEFGNSNRMAQRNSVLTKAKTASETYGRKFYVMYDTTSMGANFVTQIESDWTNTIKGSLNLLNSSAYAKQNGLPVVCIWGIGFNDGSHPGDAATSISLINWFKAQGCYVIGGVPTYWRDCDNAHPYTPDYNALNDSKTGFQNVYKTFNMIEPWFVTRIRGISGTWSADNYKTYIIGPDLSYCNANGMDYAPVMFPGFAWSNWHSGSPRNEIPRLHGNFMWNQAFNIATLGITSGYIAMFDEYDEGTAIAKAAEDITMIPTNQYFLTLDADGVHCTSDFYLRLSGDITKMLKGQLPKTSTHPTAH
jgi:hypothetical protein